MLLPELATRHAWDVRTKPELDEDDLWLTPGPVVWQAERFVGAPMFYPVYRWQDFYATGPLPLIVLKGGLELDPAIARRVRGEVRYLPTNATIDRAIRRIGAPRMSTRELTDEAAYIAAFAAATRADVALAEDRHPGSTNVVLCGGKDSLNLLLLPWRNPVLAVSAEPNFPLVQQFVRDNRLAIAVERLDDRDAAHLDSEVAHDACRIGLEHVRWSGELHALARRLDGRATFWLGAMADVLTTPKWRVYSHPSWLSSLRRLPGLRGLADTEAGQDFHAWTSYYRGAMWQGGSMSIMKGMTDALVLSGYHGPAMRALLARLDLRAITRDIRPAIGEALAGGPVVYPTANPSPAPSSFRRGLAGLDRFLAVLARHGLAPA